jgi:nucleoside-diphosphate-sugar epimerase
VLVTGGASFGGPHLANALLQKGARVCVADNRLAKQLLDWGPKPLFAEGLRRTIDLYYGTKKRPEVDAILDRMLTER